MQGKKHYSEKLFTNFQLSSRVPENNFYRRLRDVLDLRWVYKATRKYYGTEGQESIDPVVFFKMILIGYFENLGSDRKIVEVASLRMDLLYFVGYDIDESLPWHSTLSRTRMLLGQEVFKEFFRDVLKQCIEKGMVAGRRQALDSVQVKANASLSSLKKKEILEDAALYAVSLTEEEQEQQEDVDNNNNSNTSQYSTTDPDARLATKPYKSTDLKYLGQVSVDTAHHVITEIQAHHADKRDSQCLEQVISGLVENLQPEGLIVEEVLADSGFSSVEALQYLEDNQIAGYIPNHGRYKSNREGFIYDVQNDCYICSQGMELKYIDTYIGKNGFARKEYRSRVKDCKHCPLRKDCIGKSAQKKITEYSNKYLFDQMFQKTESRYGRTMSKLRQSTAEPVLGTLVNFLGMRRINTRGIDQANKCMTMAAAAYNLKKLLKFQVLKVNMIAKMNELRKSIQQNILLALPAPLPAHATRVNKNDLAIMSIKELSGTNRFPAMY